MAIVDQKVNFELFDIYNQLKVAKNNARNWANKVIELGTLLKENVNYDGDASVDEKTFVNTLETVSDTYSRAIPADPDVADPAP